MFLKNGNVRWGIIAIVMLGTIINYLGRSTLGVAAPTIMKSLHMDEKSYGFITSIFQFGIMLQPLTGYILDLVRLRLGITLFALCWGVFTIAQYLASSWSGFAILRGLQGFVEGVAHPLGLKIVSEWFPAKERGLAGGIYNVGASIGSMLAPPLVAWAILCYDWRAAFLVTGGLAFAWAALWYAFYRSPEHHKALKPAELDYIRSGQESHLAATGRAPSPLSLLAQRNFWGIALPRFLADPTWGALVFWMPLYLSTARGFDLKSVALFAWLPFVAADLGCVFGPALVLWIQGRGVKLVDARRWAFSLGALLMTGVAFVGYAPSPAASIALLCLAGFAHQTLSVTVITMGSDLFKQNEVATVGGMAGTAGNLGALIFSLAIGTLVAHTGYGPFFTILSGLDILGAVLLWTLVKPPPNVPACGA